MVSDESEMAGLLNTYFSSTFTQEQSGELPRAESIYRRGEEVFYRRSRLERKQGRVEREQRMKHRKEMSQLKETMRLE